MAEGRVRVLRDPSQAADFEPGEVLVVAAADTGWAPLFLAASGVVTELGGPLSHAAIILREYGVPAVVNVTNATRSLRDGDLVRIDGDSGTRGELGWLTPKTQNPRSSITTSICSSSTSRRACQRPLHGPAEPCLAHWVRDRFPGLRAHATSRLDSPVSGLVTFALTREANRHLLEARRAGTYERVYLGITIRELPIDRGEWSWPISIDPRNPKRRVAGPGRGEREALTRYEVVCTHSERNASSAQTVDGPDPPTSRARGRSWCAAVRRSRCTKANGARSCPTDASSRRAA